MLSGMFDSLSDPHTRHAMIVHIPIALGALGLLPLIGLAAMRFSSTPLKVLCIAWFLVASGGAALAANAGSQAEERIERAATPAAKAALEQHEELGENGWIWPLIPAALIAVTLVRRRSIAVGAGALAMAAAVGVTAWVAATGHTGGQLVYAHGLGVGSAQPIAAAPMPAPMHSSDDD